MRGRADVADGPDVTRAAAPYGEEKGTAAGRRVPRAAGPVHCRALSADGPDVVCATAPDGVKGDCRAARDWGPGAAEPVHYHPRTSDGPDIAGAAAPHSDEVCRRAA